MAVGSTLATVISIFLLLLAGYGVRKAGVLKAGDASVVNSLIIYLTMPAFIFVNAHSKPLTSAMVKAPFLAFAIEMAIMGLAYLIARAMKLDRKTTGALMLVATFGNTGFLGYPVISAAFEGSRKAILAAVILDQFAMSMMVMSIGVVVAIVFSGAKFSIKSVFEFLKCPLFPATIIALIFKDAHVPLLIMKTLGYLGAGTVPLAMISIGLSLSTGSVKNYPLPLLVAVGLKMVLMPVIVYFTLPLIGITGIVAKVVVVECAMPSAVFTGVVTGEYGGNSAFAAAAVFITTLLSVLVVPFVFALVS